MSFRTDLETAAQNRKDIKIGPELLDAYIMDKQQWTYPELRATPKHIIEELLFLWHLDNVRQKAEDREAKRAANRD